MIIVWVITENKVYWRCIGYLIYVFKIFIICKNSSVYLENVMEYFIAVILNAYFITDFQMCLSMKEKGRYFQIFAPQVFLVNGCF